MKKYEIMTITNLNLGEEGATNISNAIKDMVLEFGGTVLSSDFWGKRNFAYEINHQNAGYYEIINFEATAEGVKNLEDKLTLTEGLVRYLITAQS